jgi:Rrf2 family protein
MRLSKRCEHGLKASVQLALHSAAGYLQAKEIAEAEELPGKFIESILSSLRAASILESKVGAKGGYRLARPAGEIYIADLINALESDLQSGREDAEDMTPGASALTLLNRRIDSSLADALSGLTLEDLTGLHSIDADQATPTGEHATGGENQNRALAGCAGDA